MVGTQAIWVKPSVAHTEIVVGSLRVTTVVRVPKIFVDGLRVVARGFLRKRGRVAAAVGGPDFCEILRNCNTKLWHLPLFFLHFQ